jgi:N-acetylglucosamine-6-phosphate deacetylase
MNTPPQVLHGRILTRTGWITGKIGFDTHIRWIEEEPVSGDTPSDLPQIVPGFIDLHVHGGANVDIMQGGASANHVARLHASHGTTAMLGTTMTAPIADIEHALHGLATTIDQPDPEGARILGVHLEGPFLNAKRLGAQPPMVIEATREMLAHFQAIAPIKVITLAPEIAAHLDLIPVLSSMGMRVQVGHSSGSYTEGVAALRAGVAGFTHLFNGMTGLNHYEPGMVGAALAHAEFAELIPDLHHVHPGAMRAAMRAIPKLYCVTDATSATGMPDGEYALGSQRVLKCLGCVRLATGGSLAGSSLTMDQALRNLVSIGLSVGEASDRLSRFPADYLGLEDRGKIAPGAWADLVVLDQQLAVRQVVLEGRPLHVH